MRFPSFRCTAYNNEFREWSDSGVQATISDKRRSVCNEELGIAYFEAEVLTQTDYYPFGATMPDRQWSAGAEGYRYGFNGMERDDETYGKGNALDFGARIYDSRLGRWLSVDAMVKGFPSFSPFHYSSNNPIRNIDVGGAMMVPYDVHTQERLGRHFQEVFTAKKNNGRMATLLTSHMSPDGALRVINEKAFKKACRGLSPEQRAIARGYFETVNSEKRVIVLIGKGGDPIPEDFFPNKKINSVTKEKKIEDIAGARGGGTTVTIDGSVEEMECVAASVIVQEDFNHSELTLNILNERGEAYSWDDGRKVAYKAKGSGSLNETILHEIVGQGYFEGIAGLNQQEGDVVAIQVTNIHRREVGQLPRSDFSDHGVVTGADKRPVQDVTATPPELKK